MPSPRDIPSVKRLWHCLPYEKFVVKYKPQEEAYSLAKAFFNANQQYTHLVICADDLEIPKDCLDALLKDAEEYETICGYCNLDEENRDTYDIQPIGVDYTRDKPDTTAGRFFNKENMPRGRFLEVGHCGSVCRVISRRLFHELTWKPGLNGGWYDWQITRDLHGLGIPNMVDTSVFFYHRRMEQSQTVKLYQKHGFPEGYSYTIKR